MLKKVTLVSLVLFGFVLFVMAEVFFADASAELEQAKSYYQNGEYQKAEQSYQDIVNQYPGTNYAFEAQKGLTMAYIAAGNQQEAEASYAKLLVDFSDNEQITQAVYEIAETYRHRAKFEQSLQVYQDVVTKWPASSEAVWAQRGAAVSNIALDKMTEAQAELDKLNSDFSADPNIAEAVFNVADAFYWFKHYEKANELYQHVLNTWPGAEHAMWAQMGLAISNIVDGNDVAAKVATQRLIADYAGNERLPEALFYIAGRYEWSNKFKQAKSIYQQIAQQYPESPQTGEVPFALARINVSSLVEAGDNSAVLTAVDELIIDFNDRPDLPAAISRIEEIYYYKILAAKPPQSEDYLGAINVWEKAIQRFPDFLHPDADLYYFIACCYYQLAEYDNAIGYYKKVAANWPDYYQVGGALYLIEDSYKGLKEAGAIGESEANVQIEQIYNEIIENSPESISAKYACLKLGRKYFDSQQWVDAAFYFALFWQNFPDDPCLAQVVYDLGRAYEQMGETAIAVETYEEFLKDHPTGGRIKARLEELKATNKQ